MARKRDDSKGLSIRAYADHRRARGLRGGSTKAIQKAMHAGRIRPNAHGKIDPQAADQDWERTTAPAPTATVPAEAAPALPEAGVAGRADRLSYSQSRAVREAYEARLKRLEYETKLERMVAADEVKLEAFRRARSLRDRMMTIPSRLAGALAEESNPHAVEQLLTEAMALALEMEANEA